MSFRYSITIECENLAVLAAFRGLAWYAEKSQYKMVATKGTTELAWRKNNHRSTFYFTSSASRDEFVKIAQEALLPRWSEVPGSRKDDAEPPE